MARLNPAAGPFSEGSSASSKAVTRASAVSAFFGRLVSSGFGLLRAFRRDGGAHTAATLLSGSVSKKGPCRLRGAPGVILCPVSVACRTANSKRRCKASRNAAGASLSELEARVNGMDVIRVWSLRCCVSPLVNTHRSCMGGGLGGAGKGGAQWSGFKNRTRGGTCQSEKSRAWSRVGPWGGGARAEKSLATSRGPGWQTARLLCSSCCSRWSGVNYSALICCARCQIARPS